MASAAAYRDLEPGLEVLWDKRSLRDFGAVATAELAISYDLLVIDHPHVGTSARDGSLIPLSDHLELKVLDELAAESVGGSHESYRYEGKQWGLAIDAAAQVSAFRPDLLDTPPAEWGEAEELLQAGKALWPLNPTDAICSFLTLCATAGSPWQGEDDAPVPPELAAEALDRMKRAVAWQPHCLEVSPIRTLELMSTSNSFAFSPLLFGYSNFARPAFRPALVRFADVPRGAPGGGGSLLGGAGVAVSCHCRAVPDAVRHAAWLAGADCQRGVYFDAGGQPASATAWNDERLNEAATGYFADTRATLDSAWTRPRFPGFVVFQNQGGETIFRFLQGELTLPATITHLERLYAAALRG